MNFTPSPPFSLLSSIYDLYLCLFLLPLPPFPLVYFSNADGILYCPGPGVSFYSFSAMFKYILSGFLALDSLSTGVIRFPMPNPISINLLCSINRYLGSYCVGDGISLAARSIEARNESLAFFVPILTRLSFRKDFSV